MGLFRYYLKTKEAANSLVKLCVRMCEHVCRGMCTMRDMWRSGLLCVSPHLSHRWIQSPLLSSASYTRLAGPQTVGDSPVSASHLAVKALGLQAHTSIPGCVGPYPLSHLPSLSLLFQNTWYRLEEPNLCGLPKAADGDAPWCSQGKKTVGGLHRVIMGDRKVKGSMR